MTDHPHLPGMLAGTQFLHDGLQGHGRGLSHGVAVDPGGNGGEVHRFDALRSGQSQTVSITGSQRRRFPVFTALPDGADGVDDIPRFQAVAAGQLRLTGFAAMERPAFCQQLRPCGGVDRTVHAAAA